MALLVPALLHLQGAALFAHRHVHGSAWDYLGVAAAAAASWIGVPGPGEPVLIGAGIWASRGRLDLATVLLAAWLGATIGGVVGWVVGRRAGRRLLTVRGPLHAARLRTVERGERIFERYAIVAVLLTPSWVAGINRVRPRVYHPTNALSAAVWAVGIGVGSYLAGTAVIDWVSDFGLGTSLILAALIVAAAGFELARRRGLRSRS
jgi:membrane-associated protein